MSRRTRSHVDVRAQRAHRKRSGSPARAGAGDTAAGPVDGAGPREHHILAADVSDDEEPEALVVSHWFDPGGSREPWDAQVTLTGRRVVDGTPTASDRFTRSEVVEGVCEGAGPYSLTTIVYGLRPGEWEVTAHLARPPSVGGQALEDPRRVPEPPELQVAQWAWRRWQVTPVAPRTVRTRWSPLAPLARMPAVQPGSWAAFGAIAVIVALALQATFAGRLGVDAGMSLVVTMAASVSGLIAARAWYSILHPGISLLRGGWAVDGFLAVAPIVGVGVAWILALPVGAYLDATAPALFAAVAIARVGCFFAGCCAGRISSARWAIWSSDHRIGARRVPAQLMESAAGLLLAVSTGLILVVTSGLGGGVFVLSLAGYLAARQGILRVRAESRQFSWRRRAEAASLSGGGSVGGDART